MAKKKTGAQGSSTKKGKKKTAAKSKGQSKKKSSKKPVKKKEAAKKAAAKRSSAAAKGKEELKDKKRAVSKVTAKEGQVVEKKKSVESTAVKKAASKEGMGEDFWEETKDTLKKTSDYLFFEHRDLTMILTVLILCAAFLFIWQAGAEERWSRQGWLKIEKELDKSKWNSYSWEEKVQKLSALAKEFSGTGMEVYLLTRLAKLHYSYGSEKEEEGASSSKKTKDSKKLTIKEVKEHLEKAKELFEKIKNHPLASPGAKLAATKSIEAIAKELELLMAPRKPKSLGMTS
ncbi:MAG: hypothetical protein D6785_07965 [Planctomycetota bacterium]|nr:MAG: hypothetical protein D6785_07965 [Planctomycetota bacterium]